MQKYSISTLPSNEGSSYLNEKELAEWLNLSRRTLQGWRLKGEGPAFEKFGRSVRYATATIKAWIIERERKSTSASAPPDPWGIPNPNVLRESAKGERS